MSQYGGSGNMGGGGGMGGGYPPPPGGGGYPPPPPPPGGGGGPLPFGAPGGHVPPWPAGAIPPQQPPKSRGPVALIAIGGIVLSCVACLAFGAYLEKKDKDTYGALAVACSGQPVPGARPYAPTPGAHHVVGFTQRDGTWHVSNSPLPDDLVAQGVADTELVACIGEAVHTRIETCSFVRTRYGIEIPGSERDYPRTQAQLPVRLVAAATGAIVRDGPVVGPKPKECDDYIGRNPGESDFAGDDPGKSEFGAYLRGEMQQIPVEVPPPSDGMQRVRRHAGDEAQPAQTGNPTPNGSAPAPMVPNTGSPGQGPPGAQK